MLNKKQFTREWRKARIAARLIRMYRRGIKLSPSRVGLAHKLADDPSVTDRLIEQALDSLNAQ